MNRELSKRRAVVLFALLVTSCFPVQPVREKLEIAFHEDGVASVKVHVSLANGDLEGAVKERMSGVRQEYARQTDPWSIRFQRLQPEADRYAVEHHEGVLVEVEREIVIPPADVTEIFFDTGIQVHYRDEGGVGELSIYAGKSQRATREQQRLYDDLVEGWGHDYVRYLRAMEHVYTYMDAQPERAALLFGDLIGEEREDEDDDLPTTDEKELLKEAHDAMDQVISVFASGEERAYSLEEISSLVNDPFPAAVSIRPGGRVTSHEGFELDENDSLLHVPRASLWAAVGSLRGRWLTPDPLAAVVDHGLDESTPLPSSAALAALPRHVEPPRDASVVWDEVRERMSIPTTFRATWVVAARN